VPAVIAPGDSLRIPVRITVGTSGSFTSRLVLTTDACVGDVTALVRWSVLRPAWRAPDTIRLPVIIACGDTSQQATVEIEDLLVPPIINVDTSWVEAPFQIVGQNGRTLTIGWTPMMDGTVTAGLSVVLAPCGDTVRMIVVAERRSVGLDVPPRIVLPEDPEEAVIPILNTGTAPVTISAVRTVTAGFTLEAQLPVVLQPGETGRLTVRVAAGTMDDSTDVLIETNAPCPAVLSVRVVRTLFVETTVSIPTIEATTGSVVSIPLLVRDVRTNVRNRIGEWHCRISFDRTALAPWANTAAWVVWPGVTTTLLVDDDTKQWMVSGTWTGSDTLAVLQCLVLLDTAIRIPVTLSPTARFDWKGAGPTVTRRIVQEDGAVVLVDDICSKPRRLVSVGEISVNVLAIDVLGRILASAAVAGTTEDDILQRAHALLPHAAAHGLVIVLPDGTIHTARWGY
jgi:hypothetical protein